ncbi:glycosyltransferase family 2 protein [Nitrospira lenta]|uniref:Glycosyltransferase involved in cell wall biogenesis n=1 Tax=Nitrospira lenta TaxID=1436998 RepID=A0A330L1Y6_9BACT|nr:glycosyltransferase family 2 protein [Nitrospira lenta]SPP63644.1 Glycosyltransferase involved in cell wall biogenesis [Nitrospira lenta]
MKSSAPLVTVIIPTRNRPQLVIQAVRSALRQTLETIEVVVIVDGPDDATVAALGEVEDSRLLVKVLSRHLGPAGARNAGVDAAQGRWIAFLDHDDEWFPSKLDLQLCLAQQSALQHPIISCSFIKRSATADVLLPHRLPAPGELMSDYLFRRTGFFGGGELIQTSTIFTSRTLLQQCPFRQETGRHDDLDWLLRASLRHDTTVQFVATGEPLAIWHRPEHLETISSRKDWWFSFSWIQQNRHLVTSRAYASFLLTWVSANAIEQGDRSAFWPILKEAFRHGTPGILDGIVFAGIWLIPQAWRRRTVSCLTAARN